MNAPQRFLSPAGLAAILTLGILAGCSDGPSEPAVPAAVAVSGTVPASATVGTVVPASVVVTTSAGKPVKGASVTFEVAGGGTVTAATAVTDGSGIASPGTWTLGTKAGENTLTARVGSVTPAVIRVEGRAASPAAIAAVEGNAATAPAGLPMSTPPGVKVTDQFGNPVANVQVTFTAGPGSGTVTGGVVATGADGIARPGEWRLGTGAGAQTLRAQAVSFSTTIQVTASAGTPSVITAVGGTGQSATVGTAVPTPPTVRVTDQFGNPVSGVAVQFVVKSGGGSITGASQVSDTDGLATVGSWLLGTVAGQQTLEARLPTGTATTIPLSARADVPASVAKAAGEQQQARPNAPVPTAPVVRVLDRFGNGVSGVNVTFEVITGGGDVAVKVSSTDSLGAASPGIWVLGPTEGSNSLRATVPGFSPVTFSATAQGEPVTALRIEKFAGDNTTCPLNTTDCRFTVMVTSLTGKPMGGERVIWSAGGITQATTTNAYGRAMSPNLASVATRGAAKQVAKLEASGDSVVFAFEAVDAGQFNIEVSFIGNATPSQQAIFTQAKERWEKVITGELSNITFNAGDAGAGVCGVAHPAIVGTIDDVRIYIEVVAIDGVGSTLGSAGPCYYRSSTKLPIIGIMKLDLADVANMESNGTLYDVVLHEMGHVLGIGTLWRTHEVIVGHGGSDPYFSGKRAISGFILAGGVLTNGVPVENSGGQGTRDGHWRETVFSNELMTGFISSGTNPLSALTIASLMDLGYQVNFGVADAYAIPGATAGFRAFAAAPDERNRLREVPGPMPRPAPRGQ